MDGSYPVFFAGVAGHALLHIFYLYVVIKYLAPSFNNKLAMINSSDTATEQKRVVTTSVEKHSYADLLSRIFTRGFAERMGFVFTWKMTSRSRDFKMKVYPSIG